MKKILILMVILGTMVTFTEACTKTKKKIDIPGTIILYILLQPQASTVSRCAYRDSAGANVLCKEYSSNTTSDTDCTDTLATTVASKLKTAGVNTTVTYFKSKVACDTTSVLTTKCTTATDNGAAGTYIFYSAFFDDTKAAAFCK